MRFEFRSSCGAAGHRRPAWSPSEPSPAARPPGPLRAHCGTCASPSGPWTLSRTSESRRSTRCWGTSPGGGADAPVGGWDDRGGVNDIAGRFACGGTGRGTALGTAGRRQRGEPGRQRGGSAADGRGTGDRGLAVICPYRRLRTADAPGPPRRGRPRSATTRAKPAPRSSTPESGGGAGAAAAASCLRSSPRGRAGWWYHGAGSSAAGVAVGTGQSGRGWLASQRP